ncbi:MAG: hypothetical protein WBA31_06860 [Candidatus Dormiibacterota bacterium]
MSQEVIGGEAEPGLGLSLDQRHSLVAVTPGALEALWRSSSGGGLGWLLFRSRASAQTQVAAAAETPPLLWFEASGQRTLAELTESAGWGEDGAAAVALFELPSGPGRELGQLTKCGIEVEGGELTAELPPAWLEYLRATPPKSH